MFNKPFFKNSTETINHLVSDQNFWKDLLGQALSFNSVMIYDNSKDMASGARPLAG